jgi:leucyl-tRNA synthetase
LFLKWAGSCWYYLRFIDPQNHISLFGKDESKWLPVDIYVGGQEHAVLHLLYARFWHKVLFDLGLVDHKEPFSKLVHQGMILGADGEKMSKSRGNVINPDDIVKEHGADALRLYEMFMGPLEAVKPWQTSQLVGVVRFRDRLFGLTQRPLNDTKIIPTELITELHRTIKKVTNDIEKLSFNTAISSLMIFTNTLCSIQGPIPRELVRVLLLLLSPIAPHVAEEGWQAIGETTSITKASWPVFDDDLCRSNTSTIAIQINGKVRGKVVVDQSTSQDQVFQQASLNSNVQKYLQNSTVSKIVYVERKILNIIVDAKK